MNIEDEILVNMFGQDLISISQLTDKFELFDLAKKKEYLNDLLFLIIQSKPTAADIEPAIENSGLRPTFTPCVLLKKGVNTGNLKNIIALPESELIKAFTLLLNVFKIAYKRRLNIERNNPNKWWYWDLSDEDKITSIKEKYQM